MTLFRVGRRGCDAKFLLAHGNRLVIDPMSKIKLTAKGNDRVPRSPAWAQNASLNLAGRQSDLMPSVCMLGKLQTLEISSIVGRELYEPTLSASSRIIL